MFAPQILHKPLFLNAPGSIAFSQEHFKTISYAKFGGQTECIMGNWKIVNVSPVAPRFTPAPLIRLVRYYEQWLPVGDPGVLLRMGSFLQNTVTWDKNTLLDGKRKEKQRDYMILKANILSFKFPQRCLPSSKMFLHQVNVFLQRGTLPR